MNFRILTFLGHNNMFDYNIVIRIFDVYHLLTYSHAPRGHQLQRTAGECTVARRECRSSTFDIGKIANDDDRCSACIENRYTLVLPDVVRCLLKRTHNNILCGRT